MTRELCYVAIAAIAYVFGLTYIGGPSNLELSTASLLLLMAAGYKAQRVMAGDSFGWGRAHPALVGYLGVLILLLYTSTLVENSLHFAWLFSSFVLVVFLTADVSRDRWLFAYFLFSLTGIVCAGWGLGEYISTAKQSNGPIVDPNSWATVSNLFFFATLAVYLTTRKFGWALLALLAVLVTAVFAAYSRMGMVVFFAAFGFALLVAAKDRLLWRRLAAVIVVVAVSFVAVHSYSGFAEARDRPIGFTVTADGWGPRFTMWNSAVQIYQEYPLFGSGPGTFRQHYPKYRDHGDLKTTGNFTHNDYLQYLAEGGPLLFLFLAAFALFLVHGLVTHVIRHVKGEREQLEPILLTVAMGTSLAHALMNFPLYLIQIQMMLALLFARYLAVRGLVVPRTISLKSPGLARVGVVLSSLYFAMVLVADAVSMDLVLNQDRIPMVRDIGDSSQGYFETMKVLTALRSRNWANRFAMSSFYRQSFDAQTDVEARRSLAIAAAFEAHLVLELNPFHNGMRRYFVEFLEQNPWLQEVEGIESTPEQLLREAVALYPVYAEVHMDLADYMDRQGRHDEAYRVLVDDALPWINLRYGDFHTTKHQLALRVLSRARARGDTDALTSLLERLQ